MCISICAEENLTVTAAERREKQDYNYDWPNHSD